MKVLNDTGLAAVWEKMKAWASGAFAPLSHDHADIGGNAGSAARFVAPFTISLTGDVTGEATFDGSGDVSIPTTYDLEGENIGVLPINRGGTGASTAVAARKNLKIQCGVVTQTVASLATCTYTTIPVVFPIQFDGNPIIVLSGAASTSGRMAGLVMNVGTRYQMGFEIVLYNPTSGASGAFQKTIYWVAMDRP